jgi:hypothetical protein
VRAWLLAEAHGFFDFQSQKNWGANGISDITAVASDVPDRAVEGSHVIKKRVPVDGTSRLTERTVLGYGLW